MKYCEAQNCNNSLNDKRPDAKYCSESCKQKSKRARKIRRITAVTKVEFPGELLKELNFRVGRINAGIADSSDLVMIDTIMEYVKTKLKESYG